jgi:glycine dehydrogenase
MSTHPDLFIDRHLGSTQESDLLPRLQVTGHSSLTALIEATVPANIRRPALELPAAIHEHAALAKLRTLSEGNQVCRSFIGLGYHHCFVPPVIQRNILENPGWYTQYTPYQAEIAQGRLEALLTFQTMVCDLTALPIANASLLDEATAAAEAMHVAIAHGAQAESRRTFIVHADCHPQTIDVVHTRAKPLGITVLEQQYIVVDEQVCGVLLQYPGTDGSVGDWRATIERIHAAGALAIVATDLLALCLLTPPGELGADIALGSAQRFGVPLGFGGPHAAFFACSEALKRNLPGRLVGVSRDRHGRPAYRLALQTREQHIRREKATSNICTAQALLANMAAMYAVYHGPEGLRKIAAFVHAQTSILAASLAAAQLPLRGSTWFDTVTVMTGTRTKAVIAAARAQGINLRCFDERHVTIALDETVTAQELDTLLAVFKAPRLTAAVSETAGIPAPLRRQSAYLTHEVFHRYHTEHELLRYLKRLENKDFSLTHGMIPLGSCTMKLNATAQMLPVSWPQFSNLHPFAPAMQTAGWRTIFGDLERWLGEITGLPGVSLQPNAGSQGEYAGLLAIQGWHASRGHQGRTICLIPMSAHGTNPASAVMAGLSVVPVACDAAGNIDVADLKAKAELHRKKLSCLMITYPSTHGVFEAAITDITAIIHRCGGQVYMDGANMNAQVGLTSPGAIGADVCHLNLHKTFCIPHGGGGPGMGPICVAAHLTPFLPGHALVSPNGRTAEAVSAAPWGSASILLIPWVYITLMGPEGLTQATRIAILNANYLASRLKDHYPVLYTGVNGTVAHECIIDLRPLKAYAGVEAEDVAKRLMDYGFHAPTLSFPVVGTLMIEPTESESLAELDRFADALIRIKGEIDAIAAGTADRKDNVLKNAPHTEEEVCADTWLHPYSRELAAFPAPWVRGRKFWPAVGRIDAAWGDRNLICSCVGMDAFAS